MLKIKRKGLVKPWKKRLAIRFTRGVAFSASLIAISLISVGFLYTWVVGKNVKNIEEKIDTTIARADLALYRAKDGGRNRVKYDSVMYPESELTVLS